MLLGIGAAEEIDAKCHFPQRRQPACDLALDQVAQELLMPQRMTERRTYALRLAYAGASFRGWQRQPGQATVQNALEDALATLPGRERPSAETS